MEIWKYPLVLADQQMVEMPTGARILALQVQRDRPCLWALVDPDAPMTDREISIIGTGHPIENPGSYLGTYQEEGGHFVWHVFDSTPVDWL